MWLRYYLVKRAKARKVAAHHALVVLARQAKAYFDLFANCNLGAQQRHLDRDQRRNCDHRGGFCAPVPRHERERLHTLQVLDLHDECSRRDHHADVVADLACVFQSFTRQNYRGSR